ncbi:unnamed protein product, partial [Rotaria socialis]
MELRCVMADDKSDRFFNQTDNEDDNDYQTETISRTNTLNIDRSVRTTTDDVSSMKKKISFNHATSSDVTEKRFDLQQTSFATNPTY